MKKISILAASAVFVAGCQTTQPVATPTAHSLRNPPARAYSSEEMAASYREGCEKVKKAMIVGNRNLPVTVDACIKSGDPLSWICQDTLKAINIFMDADIINRHVVCERTNGLQTGLVPRGLIFPTEINESLRKMETFFAQKLRAAKAARGIPL